MRTKDVGHASASMPRLLRASPIRSTVIPPSRASIRSSRLMPFTWTPASWANRTCVGPAIVRAVARCRPFAKCVMASICWSPFTGRTHSLTRDPQQELNCRPSYLFLSRIMSIPSRRSGCSWGRRSPFPRAFSIYRSSSPAPPRCAPHRLSTLNHIWPARKAYGVGHTRHPERSRTDRAEWPFGPTSRRAIERDRLLSLAWLRHSS
jgi:hypothetical protein